MATAKPKVEIQTDSANAVDLNEMVSVAIPRSYNGIKNFMLGVNGKKWNIRTGVTVQLPRYAAMVLQNSIDSDNATADMIDAEENASIQRARKAQVD